MWKLLTLLLMLRRVIALQRQPWVLPEKDLRWNIERLWWSPAVEGSDE